MQKIYNNFVINATHFITYLCLHQQLHIIIHSLHITLLLYYIIVSYIHIPLWSVLSVVPLTASIITQVELVVKTGSPSFSR